MFPYTIGSMEKGPNDRITDVNGVRVGQVTLNEGSIQTGVTVIMPGEGHPFLRKKVAASFVANGFGKTLGLVQMEELGTLETPIALTNTLNVGIVHDALVEYTIASCEGAGVKVTSVNPVVCECNDARLNEIALRAVRKEHVLEAIGQASEQVEEGSVGAGRGTICFGMKGGIGTASRIFRLDGRNFTLGVLVQTNFGARRDFTHLPGEDPAFECDQGSCIVICATDAPLSDRQLRRVVRRAGVGLIRCGSMIGHGSGEIFVGFSTANPVGAGEKHDIVKTEYLREDVLNTLFRAAAEATEEAVLRSMWFAEPVGEIGTLRGECM